MYINPINSILDLSGHPPVGLDWGSQLCIRSRSSWTSGFWGEVFGKRQGWKTMGNYRANWENVGKTGKYRKIWKHIGTSGKLWETSLIEIGSEVKPPPKSILSLGSSSQIWLNEMGESTNLRFPMKWEIITTVSHTVCQVFFCGGRAKNITHGEMKQTRRNWWIWRIYMYISLNIQNPKNIKQERYGGVCFREKLLACRCAIYHRQTKHIHSWHGLITVIHSTNQLGCL